MFKANNHVNRGLIFNYKGLTPGCYGGSSRRGARRRSLLGPVGYGLAEETQRHSINGYFVVLLIEGSLRPMDGQERSFVKQKPGRFATSGAWQGLEEAHGGDARQRELGAGDGVEEVQRALLVGGHDPAVARADPQAAPDRRLGQRDRPGRRRRWR